MKWYNFETAFVSLKNALCEFLKLAGIRYECSSAPGNYHFEILCNSANVQAINDWLDAVSITIQ